MKKILLTALASFLLFAVVHSQVPVTPTDKPAMTKEQWDKDLQDIYVKAGLSDAEIAQVKPVMDNFHEQKTAIKNDMTLSKDAKKERYKELLKNRNDKLSSILGDEKTESLKREIGSYRKSKGLPDETDIIEKE